MMFIVKYKRECTGRTVTKKFKTHAGAYKYAAFVNSLTHYTDRPVKGSVKITEGA